MAKKNIKIVDLIERFGRPRIVKALTKRKFTNKKRAEERKTGQKHMGFKKGKKIIVPPKKPKFQTEDDLPRSMKIDTTTSAYGDAGKGRPVPTFKKSKPGKRVGGMTAGSRSALGRLEKAQMVKNGYSAKPFPLVDKEGKPKKSKPPKKEPYRDKGKGEYRKMKIGGLVDYYKDII